MTAAERIRALANELGRIQGQIGDNLRARDGDWKLRFVNLRRDMAVKLGEISAALDAAEGSGLSPERLREGRDLFSKMRATIALHQSKWPAVAIDADEADYAASSVSVRAANEAFQRWVRDALGGSRN